MELRRKKTAASGGKTRKPKKRARPRKGAGHALGVMIFIVSCAAALLLLYFALLVDELEVEGNTSVSSESILAASGLEAGQHMFLLDEKSAVASILSNPYLDSVEIVRAYPDTVILRVVERVPRACIASSTGDGVVIDHEGNVLTIGAQDGSLILVYGMGNAGYTLGRNIDESAEFQAATLVSILHAVENAFLTNEVESVNIANALSIELSLRTGYLVKLGQPDSLEDKFLDLAATLKELQKKGLTGGTIYLAARGGPVYSPEDAGDVELPPDGEISGSPEPEQSPEPTQTPGGDDPFSG